MLYNPENLNPVFYLLLFSTTRSNLILYSTYLYALQPGVIKTYILPTSMLYNPE